MTAGITALLAGLSLFLVIWAIFSPKKPVKKNLQPNFFRNTFEEPEEVTLFTKYVRPMLANFLPQLPLSTDLTGEKLDKVQQLITRSGNPWGLRPEEYKGTQFLFTALGTMAGFVLVALDVVPMPSFLVIILAGVMGYAFPYSVYNSARQAKARDIQKQLPDALDLLVVTMNSGQNFEPALGQVTPRLPDGMLKNEFNKISTEIASGRTLESSLMSFANRAASEEAESFARSVAQAQRLGADVSQTLASQAKTARSNYEALLEKKIARLSSTMFMFLVPTMLPAIVLIFVAPSLSQLSGGLL
jgi:tight adherence protein C